MALSEAFRHKPAARGNIMCAIAVAALSFAYYAFYIDAGFNAADDGNYAQISYELFLGRPVDELAFNYGLLWFQLGEAAFHLFGVKYVFVQGVFFLAIALTNVLLFFAVLRLSGNRGFALAMSVIPALAPAFPATAFYGLCILLNVAAQLRLAAHLPLIRRNDAILAGAALALSFQLRPDFAYVFGAALVLMIVFAARGGSAWRRDVGAIAVGAMIAFAPFVLLAALGGYLGSLVSQYLAYPVMMVEYLIAGFSGTVGTGESGSFLLGPALSTVFTGPNAPFALLYWLPLLVIAIFIGLNASSIQRWWRARQYDRLSFTMIALLAGLAAFPHYFLFRPDLAHIANFMPGFTVLAAALLWQVRQGSAIRRTVAAIVIGHLALYGWVGLQSPGTGSIALAKDRTERFAAGNGIDVRLSPAEHAQLQMLHDIVLQNSKPGDAIVCLPYCPGIAFMTERRMFFGNFYADDSFLTRAPNWLPDAINRTRAERPPVVIISDWALNGTEISRFKNWAAPYMSMLDEIAREKITRPDLTIFLL